MRRLIFNDENICIFPSTESIVCTIMLGKIFWGKIALTSAVHFKMQICVFINIQGNFDQNMNSN